jgi:anaerobic selenocysteine-containing dehydrogenase
MAADKMASIIHRYRPESVAVSFQVPGTGYIQKGAMMRFASMFGMSCLHAYPMNGDLPMFWPMTFGVQTEEHEAREWTNSRYIGIFGSNVLITRLPDAKFLGMARDRGAKVLCVDPIRSHTALKADEWLQINPDTDTALALGIARTIIAKKSYDARFIRAFTDLPLLVRLDTKKRLLAKDVKELASKASGIKAGLPPYRCDPFVSFDLRSRALVPHNPEVIEEGRELALEGTFDIELITGERIRAKPAFELLKTALEPYTPKAVAQIIAPPGDHQTTSPNERYEVLIERLAEEMARIKPLLIIFGAGGYQWYHGDLKGRALSLIAALTGNLGRPGGGITTYSGQHKIRWPLASWWLFEGKRANYASFLLWLNESARERASREAFPKNGIRAFLFGWNNPFEQHDLAGKLTEAARSEELELIIACDFQMTRSCQWADIVLPVPSWYEKTDIVATPMHSFVQLQNPAIEPLFEAMPEAWIMKELALRLGKRLGVEGAERFWPTPSLAAQEQGANDHRQWNLGLARRLADEAAKDAIKQTLKDGGALTHGISLDSLAKGPVRLNVPETPPFFDQIHLKKPFPPPSGWPYAMEKTGEFLKTGRIELYKDDDVFLELGEACPVFKPVYSDTEGVQAPRALESYPLGLISANSLYRVHSTHGNNPTLLDFYGYEPCLWLHPKTALEREILSGDWVEAFNERGRVRARAILDEGMHPCLVKLENGWRGRSLGGSPLNQMIYPWVKPTHLLYFLAGAWEPSTAWNEVRCQVRKLDA